MLQRYASEALKEHAYKEVAGAQLREFTREVKTSKERAREALDASGADVVAVPLPEREGAMLYVSRVRKVTPGSVTLRRVEEYAGRAPEPGDAAQLLGLVREVEAEVAAARERAAKAEAAAARKREREEGREAREALRLERERVKAERAAARDAVRATQGALDRRVRTVQRALREVSAGK